MYALGVVVFIRGGIRVRPGGRLFHPVWLGSPRSALGVVGFILGNWGQSDVPWGSLDSSGVVGFTRERPGVLWVHA